MSESKPPSDSSGSNSGSPTEMPPSVGSAPLGSYPPGYGPPPGYPHIVNWLGTTLSSNPPGYGPPPGYPPGYGPPGYGPPPGYPPGYGPPGYPPYGYPPGYSSTPPGLSLVVPVDTHPMAILSSYLGLFAILPFVGLLLGIGAIWTGVIALRAIRANPQISGEFRSYIGIILGVLAVLLNGFCVGALVFEQLGKAVK